MSDAVHKVIRGETLKKSEAFEAMGFLTREDADSQLVTSFLLKLKSRGESVEEIFGFAENLRSQALKFPLERKDVVDTCGTGGDGAETYNISTASALLLASLGLGVAKHGNRSVSSRCGSADVLEALGISTALSVERARESLEKNNFAFLFAPRYHPAMKRVGAIRKSLGTRTVFNLMGPLMNPAPVRFQVLGVYDRGLTQPLAEVLKFLGLSEAMVVHGEDGLDEFTLGGKTFVSHLKDGKIKNFELSPEDLGLNPASSQELKGGDSAENAKILMELFEGKIHGPKREILSMNAGAALVVSGKAETLKEGVALAQKALDTRDVLHTLKALRSFS